MNPPYDNGSFTDQEKGVSFFRRDESLCWIHLSRLKKRTRLFLDQIPTQYHQSPLALEILNMTIKCCSYHTCHIQNRHVQYTYITRYRFAPSLHHQNKCMCVFQIKRIPGQILQLLNLPVPTYAASTSSYDLTNLVRSVFGVDIFTLMFIAMLYILASLAFVSIVLPNLYFRDHP